MKRTIVLFGMIFLFVITAASQKYKGEIDSMILPDIGPSHYIDEYDLDTPVDTMAWVKEKPGLHVAFGSEDELYFRTEVPVINNEAVEWNATGWKGERLNTQIIVWSPDTLQQVRFTISDLKNGNGKLLSKQNIQLNKIAYVLANFPYGSNEPNCGESPYKNGFLMPDRFEAFNRFDVPGKTVRPVWLSLNIPSDTKPGTYTGTIRVKYTKQQQVLQIQITVQNKSLPKPHEWKFR